MFFGREDTVEQLNGLLRKRVASFVTCRGRRRIGKSTLIERFAENTAEKVGIGDFSVQFDILGNGKARQQHEFLVNHTDTGSQRVKE